MTINDYIESLETILEDLEDDTIVIMSGLKQVIENNKFSPVDESHLKWEQVHALTSYGELRSDINRIITTLKGKGFNAGKTI